MNAGARTSPTSDPAGSGPKPEWPDALQWVTALLLIGVQTGGLALVWGMGSASGFSHIGAIAVVELLGRALVVLGGGLVGLGAAAAALLYGQGERSGCTLVVRAYVGVAVALGLSCWLGLLLPRWAFWLYLPVVELIGLFLAAWSYVIRPART